MNMTENQKGKSFIDRFFDKADAVADGLNQMIAEPEPHEDLIEAEVVQESINIIFGGITARYYQRGLIWHAFTNMSNPPLCGMRGFHSDMVESYRRANVTSKEAIVFCFGCLSKMEEKLGGRAAPKQLTSESQR